MDPMNPSPPATATSGSNQGTIALVLGILGLLCCPILAPIAWYLGSQEVKAIRARPTGGDETLAKVGMILGIIGTAFLVLWLIYVFVFGGLAVVQGLLGS